MKYAEFIRQIDKKEVALLKAGFYDTEDQKKTILTVLEAGLDCTPINIGMVTVRSNDFYRTYNGKNSYCSRQAGTEIYNKDNFYLLLTPTNYVFYKVIV